MPKPDSSNGRKRYVLWFTPAGDTRARLRRLIGRLAARYAAQPFVPHVTLLSQLAGECDDILAVSTLLAARLTPFRIDLTRIGYRDSFYECLFIHARRSHALVRANRLARAAFMRADRGRFMPHLSLLYGDLPVTAKERIIERTGSQFDLAFDVRYVELWEIRGAPSHWRRVARLPLGVRPRRRPSRSNSK